MGMASRVVFALDGLGLGPQVAVVTDGQLSGLVNKGLVVGECALEAAEAGPIGLVREGDRIRIDIPARRADLLVDAAELAARHAAHPRTGATPPAGWLSIYARTAKPLEAGATLHDPPEA
jgi:dihydroxy-acid dehydratase